MIGLVLGVLIGIGIGKSDEAGSQASTGTTETYSEQPPPTYSEQESSGSTGNVRQRIGII